jgi:hypothetical protein
VRGHIGKLFKSLICPFQLGSAPGESVFRHSATRDVDDDSY